MLAQTTWAPFTVGGTFVLVDGAVCVQVPRSQPRASLAGGLADSSVRPAPLHVFCPLSLVSLVENSSRNL